MKGLNKIAKGEDEIFLNSGYYYFPVKQTNQGRRMEDIHKFMNAYTNEELFDYVGEWFSNGGLQLDNASPPLIAKLENENGTYKEFHMKYLSRGDLKISYKRKVTDNGIDSFIDLPPSIPKVNFINTYFVYIDNERADYLVLKPAIRDYNPKASGYYLFGEVPARELGGTIQVVPIDMGFHSLATKSNFTGVKFLGVYCGPDLFLLCQSQIPARLVLEARPGPGFPTTGNAHLELYLPLHGLKMYDTPYPDPDTVIIKKETAEQWNFFIQGLCLYKIGMTTIEGYKLAQQPQKVLYFDNGFKMYDLDSGLLNRNIIDFGTEITFINNDMYRVADARKREIMSSLIGTAISTGLGMVPGILTGRSLVKAGKATINFSKDSTEKTSGGLLKMNAEKRNMGNLQLSLLQEEFKKKKNPTDVDKEILRLESNIQRSRNALIGERQLFDTENIKQSRERGVQIGESQKIAGHSQIMYSGISPASAITGGATQIVSFINERTQAPANITVGANTATQSDLTFWSEEWYKYTLSKEHEIFPAQGIWSQSYIRYQPNKEYIKKINLNLLDNGVNVGLYLKLKDILKVNPNSVLNIDPDSIMKIFYKYFDYLPIEFEQEILEFFIGTFVYWTEKYPEHRGQSYRMVM